MNRIWRGVWLRAFVGLGLCFLVAGRGLAQDDALDAITKPDKKPDASEQVKSAGKIDAPTKDNPEATVAESVGPIKVESDVSDADIREKLTRLLPQFPGVRSVEVEVEDGVVTLRGHVEDSDVRDRLRDFVRRVEGVTLVLNRTKTDAQVLGARQYAEKRLLDYWDVIRRKWLLAVLAVLFIAAAVALARLLGKFGDVVLQFATPNPLLRSVLGSMLSGLIVVAGFLAALNVLGLTEAVLSFLGLAGVVALAIGFAFRDIAENFIASVLLGIRRPFRIGDYIELAGQAGIVRALNTRATVLVTLDGAQVRIPNAKVFKEIQVNKTASTSVRSTFDVLIPYNASVDRAQKAIGEALEQYEPILHDPPPRALVESLQADAVCLRVYFWMPARDVDGFQINSDARLKAKVALQEAGIVPGAPATPVSREGGPPHSDGRAKPGGSPSDGHASANHARRELERDAQAARECKAPAPPRAAEHAMDAAEDRVGDEGEDLIDDAKSVDESAGLRERTTAR